ncbi:MAG: hypothetical protein FD119_3733 [Stygiobacter sp.]|nr:MAG: hypothetical protein FD119_3733 [Stygiobacter sp.]
MIVASYNESFVIEFANSAFYARIPLIGVLFIGYNQNRTPVPFSTEKDGGESLGYWGKVNWVLTPWSVERGARA